MRELVQSAGNGRIRRTNWIITDWYRPQAYYDSGDWRATWSGEGGGVPPISARTSWICGRICGMPVAVQSNMRFGQWHDIEVEDDVTTYVEYENGATGVFVTTTGDACGTNRFEIQMDGAKLVVENDKLTVIEFDMPEPEFSRTANTVPFGFVGRHEVPVETDGLNEQRCGRGQRLGRRDPPRNAAGGRRPRGHQRPDAVHRHASVRFHRPKGDAAAGRGALLRRADEARGDLPAQEGRRGVLADTSNTYGGAEIKGE